MPRKTPEEKRTYYREWKRRNPDKVRAYRIKADSAAHRQKRRVYHKAYLAKLKEDAFHTYGGCFCVCCGEAHIQFLSVDHIGGKGNEHRRQLGLRASHVYKWLKDNHYPPGYRVLCMNCNFALGLFGFCPHGTLAS